MKRGINVMAGLSIVLLALCAGMLIFGGPAGCGVLGADPNVAAAEREERKSQLEAVARAAADAEAAAREIAKRVMAFDAALSDRLKADIEAMPAGAEKEQARELLAKLESERDAAKEELAKASAQVQHLTGALKQLPGVVREDGSIDLEQVGAVIGAAAPVAGPWGLWVGLAASAIGAVGAAVKAAQNANQRDVAQSEQEVLKQQQAELVLERARVQQAAERIVRSIEKAREEVPAFDEAFMDERVRTVLRQVQGTESPATQLVDQVQAVMHAKPARLHVKLSEGTVDAMQRLQVQIDELAARAPKAAAAESH